VSESLKPHYLLSVEEYLELERDSSVRHEYVGGELYAMTGASRRHNRIAGNIYRRLADAAEGSPCRVYISDMKVRLKDAFYYPDVMVACEEPPEDEYTEDAPCMVVEVLSPGTEGTDRREKLAAYQSLPSLRMYLIVAQDERLVTHYSRDASGRWRRGDLTGEGRFDVPCPPSVNLTLDAIYAGL
jgi:Uma2 family endonuclease